ncbi:hypothetical protein FN976_17520 [Caenimonas sedimenti]|uniref:Uncharacterized protein n=1 Tax=Caenimonas sedimenti TaxID=2596921 RepID=A0A562ZPP5_9BURK|nr:hypothetical protein [Caenimonas sedimenti]TWO70134.1 hypothetical protein FN976_17520 [Caenimonas sedimenti]
MATAQTIERIEKLIWVLAYGGLILLVLGLATTRLSAVTGWVMVVAGSLIALSGFVLIPVRARMGTADGAQSKPIQTENE